MLWCEMYWLDGGFGAMVSFCEQDNKPSSFKKGGKFLDCHNKH
jgi:hypothetical protein